MTLGNRTNNLAQKVGEPAEVRTRHLPDTSLQHLLSIVTIPINYQQRLYEDKKLKTSCNSHVSVRGLAMLLVTSHELCGPERDQLAGNLPHFRQGCTSETIYADCMDVM